MTSRTVAHWAPLSTGFSRQEYWSGLLFPALVDLSHPVIGPRSPALQVDSLPTELSEKPYSDLNGKEIQERGDICICIADSLCCSAETNTTL